MLNETLQIGVTVKTAEKNNLTILEYKGKSTAIVENYLATIPESLLDFEELGFNQTDILELAKKQFVTDLINSRRTKFNKTNGETSATIRTEGMQLCLRLDDVDLRNTYLLKLAGTTKKDTLKAICKEVFEAFDSQEYEKE